MRTWMVLVMLAAVALSGCAGETSTGTDDTVEPTDSVDATGDSTVDDGHGAVSGGTETAEDAVPVLEAAADTLAGAAPLLVNFSIAAEDDSESLVWYLDVDGVEVENGTEFPAVASYTFEAGSWNVTVRVEDGTHIVTEDFVVEAQAVALEPQDAIQLTGTISGFYAADPLVGVGVGYITDPDVQTFEVTQVAGQIDFVLKWDDMGYDLDFSVIAPDGTEVVDEANYNDPIIGDGAQSESATVTDASALAQVGTWTVKVYSAGSYESAFTVDITFS